MKEINQAIFDRYGVRRHKRQFSLNREQEEINVLFGRDPRILCLS